MDMLLKLLSTAAFGALDLWIGFGAGLAVGLSPVVCGLAAVAGAVVGVGLVLQAGEWLRRWVYDRRWLAKRRKRIESMWNRYGLIGVALQAPMLTGAPLATVLALALGAPPRPLLYWMVASVLLWGAFLTGAAALGFEIFGG
ncbi:MAG: small multi-drug export protein [Actinomycetota bacterium]|nr:small multi-drug export protein [Actinomycetota bacterium]HZY64415.1 small multi-drug export protein [Rubrobacteraceae bacterium]